MKHRIIHSSHVVAPQLSNNVLFVSSISCCVQNFWWISIEAVVIFTQACIHECSIFSRNIKQFYSCSCPKHQGGTGDAGTGGGGCPQPAPEPGHGPLNEAPVPPRRCPGQDSVVVLGSVSIIRTSCMQLPIGKLRNFQVIPCCCSGSSGLPY